MFQRPLALERIAPVGEWELALANKEAVRQLFKDGQIEDVLFFITYAGRTPAWPA